MHFSARVNASTETNMPSIWISGLKAGDFFRPLYYAGIA